MTKAEMGVRLAALEAREKARTAAAREAALAKRLAERAVDDEKLRLQVRLALAALDEGDRHPQGVKRHLRTRYGWSVGWNRIRDVMHDLGLC